MPSKRPSILPEALRKLSRRPVSSRWRYWEESVSSRLTRRRGSQKPSVSRTSVSGKGLIRTCGLFEVSTIMTGRRVESSMGILISGRVLASSRPDGATDHAGDAVALQGGEQYNGRPPAPSDSIDPSLTLTRTQYPAILGKRGTRKPFTYAVYASPCKAQQPLTAHS